MESRSDGFRFHCGTLDLPLEGRVLRRRLTLSIALTDIAVSRRMVSLDPAPRLCDNTVAQRRDRSRNRSGTDRNS